MRTKTVAATIPDTVRRLLKRKGKVWKRMRGSLADRRDKEEFSQCQQAYSPELNLIEIVWRKVKYEWIHRYLF